MLSEKLLKTFVITITIVVVLFLTITPSQSMAKTYKISTSPTPNLPKSANEKYIAKVRHHPELSGYRVIKNHNQYAIISVQSREELTEIQGKFEVLEVYEDYKRFALTTPNDSYFNSQNNIFPGQYDQWNLRMSGFTPTSDPNSAWNISTGSPETIVAVIDSGVSLVNPDIVNHNGSTWGDNNIWINQGEIPPTLLTAIDTNSNNTVEAQELIQYFVSNNLDVNSDGGVDYRDIVSTGSPILDGNDNNTPPNGYPDDIFGFNFIQNSPNVNDTEGHGTHVYGIIGAVSNNNTMVNPGVAGICWACKIMPLKVVQSGIAYDSDIVEAIQYAVNNGAKVINLSVGGPGYSQPLQDAIINAWNNGVLVVAAAGNYGSDAANTYPGGSIGALSVGSLNYQNNRAFYSNTGPRLDIMAYGDNVLSTYIGASSSCVGATYYYTCISGTSISAPHVSGIAALVFDLHKSDPTPWTAREVRNALLKSAIDMNTPGFDYETGFGRVSGLAALQAPRIATDNTNPTATITGLANTSKRGNFDIVGTVSDNDLYMYKIFFKRQGDSAIIKQYVGRQPVSSGVLASVDSSTIPDGVYDVEIRAEDFYGNVTTHTETGVTIDNTPPSSFSLIAPADMSASNQTKPTFSWSESTDTGAVSYEIYLDENLVSSGITALSYTLPTDIPEGLHEWKVIAKDAAGNSKTSEIFKLYADRSPPDVFSINLDKNVNPTTITFSSSDAVSGLQGYTISINGGPFQPVSSPYSTNGLAPGNYSIVVRATDKAGNTRDAEASFVILDTCQMRKIKADYNCDGKVDISDLSILAANWNKSNTNADSTGDSITNLSDLSILAANWNKSI